MVTQFRDAGSSGNQQEKSQAEEKCRDLLSIGLQRYAGKAYTGAFTMWDGLAGHSSPMGMMQVPTS